MPQSLARKTFSALVLALSIALAGLTLSSVATAQDPTSPYTNTTPTTQPTQETIPETTNEQPPPTSEPEPTVTSGKVTPPPRANTAVQPTPNTPPKRLAFTGYDPLIVGFAGVMLMLGAVAMQRRRGTR